MDNYQSGTTTSVDKESDNSSSTNSVSYKRSEGDSQQGESISGSTSKVLVATKLFHKGMLFGHIANGGGTIKINEQYSVRIVAENDSFRTIELYVHACGTSPKEQRWQPRQIVKEEVKKPESKQKETINIEAKIQNEEAW